MGEFRLTVEYLVDANTVEEAEEAFADGAYKDFGTVKTEDVTVGKKPPVHIVYAVHDGYIKYRADDGSTGSEPRTDEEMFKAYWTTMYTPAEVTFERL